MTKPTIESWLIVNPTALSSVTPIASESGMLTMTIADARKPSGSSVSSTSRIAIMKSTPSRESRIFTFADWSNGRCMVIPAGSSRSAASAVAQRRSRTAMMFWRSCMLAVTHTARCPSSRACDAASS